ncbi:MAG TPA: FAD-linked oxidase C-terminal domain-containing protein [Nocardioides sp.]|nr:FAD-linked oxidase C-terminal domain-containing protein [Nocardioides sp.]
MAAAYDVPIVTRGRGTGLAGGASGRSDGIVLSTERMRGIAIDPQNRVAVVGPGLLNSEVKTEAAEHGLWYPPDPASFEMSSIGGNLATNAGGLCCVKYGVTADYVLGLEVVTADGRVLRLGGARLKDNAGYDLVRLMVGSEGTLGIITEATLRLLPTPAVESVAVGIFASLTDAARATAALKLRLEPSMLELMDGVALNIIEDKYRMGLDRTAGAMLIAATDTPGETGEEEVAAIGATFTEHGATEVYVASDPAEAENLVAARRLAAPAAMALGPILLEDIAVPVSLLAELVGGIQQVARDRDVRIGVVAHAGDGDVHPVIIRDPSDPDAAAREDAAFEDIMRLAVRLGGTISAEHGIGRLKRPWLEDAVGHDVFDLNRRIKDALDPQGILNPGVGL